VGATVADRPSEAAGRRRDMDQCRVNNPEATLPIHRCSYAVTCYLFKTLSAFASIFFLSAALSLP